jgi:acetyltransferase-like isoleucine patch superfamily enzyme
MKFSNLFARWKNIKTSIHTRLLRKEFASFGANSTIVPPFNCISHRYIHVGNKVRIKSHCWIEAIHKYAGIKLSPQLEISDGTSIGRLCHIITCGHMIIEENVIIAERVYISDNLHGYEDTTMDIWEQPLKIKPVIIKKGAWLGDGVCVLPGTTIGERAVIGSNSVVTGDIPSWSVAVGAPARIIKCLNPATGQWEPKK